MWQFGELGERMTRVRVLAQKLDQRLGPLLDGGRSSGVLDAELPQRVPVLLRG